MSAHDYLQLVLYVGILTFLTPILGRYLFKVFNNELKISKSIEKFFFRICRIEHNKEMNWKEYAVALLTFNFLGILVVMTIQMFQALLPANPEGMANVNWHSAFNTAVSFVTNTNWQGYAGEVTMSYFTQMTALTVQNFVSAAVGLSVAVALMRGVSRRSANTIGNFWVDMTNSLFYVLIPMSIILCLLLMGQGVIQNFSSYHEVLTLEGMKQIIPMGPVASQVAIKMLGTNGGGFFNANAAHPFENSTPFSNFLQMLSIFLIPAALTYTYGLMAKAKKHGWIIFGTMMFLFVGITVLALVSEFSVNPLFNLSGLMEGKEARFGVFNSVLFSQITTMASSGSVNTLHSSLSPLAGGLALLNMLLGEIIFGGVGAGFYGMMLFILMTVFISGLMVGRTPEYIGKKIEAKEMMMVILAIIVPCATVLIFSAISSVSSMGLSSLMSKGPHGFSEIVYAYASATGNNGSAFAGLSANVPYYNITLAIAMLIGRFAIILPILAIAGNLAKKKYSPPSRD